MKPNLSQFLFLILMPVVLYSCTSTSTSKFIKFELTIYDKVGIGRATQTAIFTLE